MQRLTFNMIGSRQPVSVLNPEDVRERMSRLGYLDPSMILKTDNSVVISIDKNIYTISSNLTFTNEENIVTTSGTIVLTKDNFGVQEVLVNMELTNDEPAYGELTNYNVVGNTITLNTQEFNNKLAHIKYLTTN